MSQKQIKSVCVLCGSALGNNVIYKQTAADLGTLMLQKKLSLVYGGSNIGLMMVIADVMTEGGGQVIGVMSENLAARKIVNYNSSELIMCKDIAERKKIMFDIADAFIALPGGYGTLDEISEFLTLHQMEVTDKPIGILNVNGFYDNLIKHWEMCSKEGFLREEHRKNIIIANTPAALLNAIYNFIPVAVDKNWVNKLIEASSK